jgi:hypothetical protein
MDIDGGILTFSCISNPKNGIITLSENGTFIYLPLLNYVGFDYFTFKASNKTLDSNISTINLTINNVLPNTHDVVYQNVTNNSIYRNNLAINMPDIDINIARFIIVSGPLYGNIILNNDGTFIYTPLKNYCGMDLFSYKINDGMSDSNISTVTIFLNEPLLKIKDGIIIVQKNCAYNWKLLDFIETNIKDFEISMIKNPSNGIIKIDIDYNIDYTPNYNFVGFDNFMYKISTDTLSKSANINVNVYESCVYTKLSIFSSAINNDHNLYEYIGPLSGPQYGNLMLNKNGTYTYTQINLNNYIDIFTFKISDGIIESNIAIMNIINIVKNKDKLVKFNSHNLNMRIHKIKTNILQNNDYTKNNDCIIKNNNDCEYVIYID